MSGILDITRHKNQWHLADVFGPYKGENVIDWEQHSVLNLINRNEDYVRSLPMLITVSTGDQCSIDDNRVVHRQLEKMKVKHFYYESPGGHDWMYWTSQLPRHVSFHAKVLGPSLWAGGKPDLKNSKIREKLDRQSIGKKLR
jgi:hypothetical protein